MWHDVALAAEDTRMSKMCSLFSRRGKLSMETQVPHCCVTALGMARILLLALSRTCVAPSKSQPLWPWNLARRMAIGDCGGSYHQERISTVRGKWQASLSPKSQHGGAPPPGPFTQSESSSGYLNLNTIGILESIILCFGGCPVHNRVIGSTH